MKRKVLSITLVIALVAIAAISTTLAYFTDTDYDVNTMVVGNVKIDQFEKQLLRDEDGKLVVDVNDNYTLMDYDDAAHENVFPASGPAYFLPNNEPMAEWNEMNKEGVYAEDEFYSWVQLFPDDLNPEDKILFVKNTGKNDLYYRNVILVEAPQELAGFPALHLNLNGGERFDWNTTKDGSQKGDDAYVIEDVVINGIRYYALIATHVEILAPDEVSRPSLVQLFMDCETTQEQAEAFGDKIDILCFTQAVQADGFDDAYEALHSAFGELLTADEVAAAYAKVTANN